MKSLSFYFLSVFLSIGLIACNQTDVLSAISLDKTVLELEIDETYQLEVFSNPENYPIKNIEWSTSDPAVATVFAGIVTAVGKGTASIVAVSEGKETACMVIVSSNVPENITPGENVDNAVRLPKSSKRGVSFSFSLAEDVELLKPGFSWSYNWGPAPSEQMNNLFNQNNLDFFPMAWNGGFDADKIREYKAKNPQCEYILAFNEPNLTDQCNNTPQQAAEHWPRLKALADELNMKLVSPAMNYGTLSGYHDPIKWLDEFFTLIDPNDIDVISIHCYMGSAAAMKSFIDMFKKYKKPIWMTEFCAWESHIGSIQAQMKYMCEALNYMECDPMVERYAWFIPRAAGPVESYPFMQLLTKTKPFELSDLGKVFVNLSSMDKTVWQSTNNHILAQTYSNICTSESLNGGFVGGPQLRLTTDETGELELWNFISNQWTEYQIDATKDITKIRIRYSNYADSKCELLSNGKLIGSINLSRTGDANIWNSAEADLSLPKGKHTIRLRVVQGNICVNWLKFE